jgi:hypothetical protein
LRGQHWVKKERIPHGNNLRFEVKEWEMMINY